MDAQERLMADNDQYKYEVRSDMPSHLGGLTRNNVIYLNSHRDYAERTCIVAEEIGHEKTTDGGIVYGDTDLDRKLERKARQWGMEHLVSLAGLVAAWKKDCESVQDVADYLEVTPEYVLDAISMYREKLGLQFTYCGYHFNLNNGIQIWQ